jgi:hypothetical protein
VKLTMRLPTAIEVTVMSASATPSNRARSLINAARMRSRMLLSARTAAKKAPGIVSVASDTKRVTVPVGAWPGDVGVSTASVPCGALVEAPLDAVVGFEPGADDVVAVAGDGPFEPEGVLEGVPEGELDAVVAGEDAVGPEGEREVAGVAGVLPAGELRVVVGVAGGVPADVPEAVVVGVPAAVLDEVAGGVPAGVPEGVPAGVFDIVVAGVDVGAGDVVGASVTVVGASVIVVGASVAGTVAGALLDGATVGAVESVLRQLFMLGSQTSSDWQHRPTEEARQHVVPEGQHDAEPL